MNPSTDGSEPFAGGTPLPLFAGPDFDPEPGLGSGCGTGGGKHLDLTKARGSGVPQRTASSVAKGRECAEGR